VQEAREKTEAVIRAAKEPTPPSPMKTTSSQFVIASTPRSLFQDFNEITPLPDPGQPFLRCFGAREVADEERVCEKFRTI